MRYPKRYPKTNWDISEEERYAMQQSTDLTEYFVTLTNIQKRQLISLRDQVLSLNEKIRQQERTIKLLTESIDYYVKTAKKEESKE